jgi:hypothetical protein
MLLIYFIGSGIFALGATENDKYDNEKARENKRFFHETVVNGGTKAIA